ncbi:MAG: nucleotidyltransferase family protein [Bacteroidaceae bacterium]|nr:nucleotidyltransferase family protein [Bacteroidaceae bacterium]
MEEVFFDLLRIAIGRSRNLSTIPTDEEWRCLYDTARKQSLLGVLFHGIQRSGMRLDKDLLLKWFLASEQIRQCNQKANKAAVELTQFFRDNGFRTCILKGQGNTLNYPESYIRTSGDIDVWVEGGCEKVLDWVRERVGNLKFCYHHIEFKKIGGVEVEVHYRPSFMNNLIHNRRMQRWFERVADEQFRHEVELPDGVGKVCVPTNAFNRIYQMAHISNHFFHEGIGFRQMLDYYFVLRQGFTEEERVRDARLLKHFGLYKMASAVMYVLQETLGMGTEFMIVSANEKLGRFLMDEILEAGNFGQHDSRTRYGRGRWVKNVQRLKRDMRLVRYFPSECLWEPVFRIWHWGWRKRFSLLVSKKKSSLYI